MTQLVSKRVIASRFKDASNFFKKNSLEKQNKMIRYHTESTEDQGDQIINRFSIPGKSLFQSGETETFLNSILKRGVVRRRNVMKTLKTQMDRSSSHLSIESCKRPKLNKQQKQNIKAIIRRSVTRKSTTRKREDEEQQKWLKQSYNKIVKELKHKTYAHRQPESDVTKIKIESYGATIKGDKHHVNQDSLSFSDGTFVICDGHGTNGKQISEFVAQTAHSNFWSNLELFAEAYSQKKIDTYNIRNMLKKVEVELDISGIDVAFSGCTFISIIIFENTIFSISVGDSKIILCNGITTSQLNTLHKPDHPIQKERIQLCGGIIHPLEIGKEKYSGPNRIWAPGKNSWGPGLALSRAFGDKAAKKYGVVSDPEIKNIKLGYEADFIVMGSDGLFDYLKDSQISFFIRKKLKQEGYNRERIAMDLVEEARRASGLDSDDISSIIIFL